MCAQITITPNSVLQRKASQTIVDSIFSFLIDKSDRSSRIVINIFQFSIKTAHFSISLINFEMSHKCPRGIISLKIGIVSVISSELIIPTDRLGCHSSFSQTDKIGNVGSIANFVILYIFSFILYLQHIMLVNVKLDVSRYKRIIFQGRRFIDPVNF